MKYGDYNTVNNIIEQLPSKTAKAPGTLLINNVDSFEQVNLEAATAKYWNVEYKHEVTNFNKKIVNGEMLNHFAKKFNKKIQNKIDIVDNSIAELREEMVILEEDDLTIDGLIDNTFPSLTTENKTLLGAINELNNNSTKVIDKAAIDEILLDVFGTTTE
jgi:hypothetical protein